MAGAITTLTLDQLAQHLDAATREVASQIDMTPAMKQCALMVAADAQTNIADGHSPDGTPFAPLKRPRANSKGSDKPLRDKGLLLASVSGGLGSVTEIGPQSMTVGSNLEYAVIHNFGGVVQLSERKRPPSAKPWVFPGRGGKPVFTRHIRATTITIPQRQFLGWSQQLIEDCAAACAEHAAKFVIGRFI